MIRSGKTSSTGWLQYPHSEFGPWAALSGITLNDVHIGVPTTSPDSNPSDVDSKGAGVVASKDAGPGPCSPLVMVPEDLVLSRQRVQEIAAGDVKLLEIFKACGNFVLIPRISILVFLLHQATLASPHSQPGMGRSSEFIGYLKLCPIPPLPTLYSEAELSAFIGTTMYPAVGAKLRKLRSEFDTLRKLTKTLPWLSEIWWGPTFASIPIYEDDVDVESTTESEGAVQFSDWVMLDAMYRSRALEWPGKGEAVVPGIDMANHSSSANAIYEVHNGSGHLVLKDGESLRQGEEVCISYGDHKSAIEMLFAYGFLPDSSSCPRSILLSLPSSAEDPLGPAKSAVAVLEDCAPGIRIHTSEDQSIKWDSEALWLMIVNEEDGLDFEILQTNDNEDATREICITWKKTTTKLRDLKNVLEKDRLFSLFELRATVLVLGQVQGQLKKLADTDHGFYEVGEAIQGYAVSLRSSENRLLEEAYKTLSVQKEALLETEVVQDYFRSMHEPSEEEQTHEEEDFS